MKHLNDQLGPRAIGAEETHDLGVVVSQPHLQVSAFDRLLPFATGRSRSKATMRDRPLWVVSDHSRRLLPTLSGSCQRKLRSALVRNND